MLGDDLPSVGSRMFLLIVLLLLKKEPVSSSKMTVCNRTIGMVRGIGVPSDGGVVVMGTIGVTTLHPREMGKAGASPSARGCVILIDGFLKNIM
jgi:hypothetical protein